MTEQGRHQPAPESASETVVETLAEIAGRIRPLLPARRQASVAEAVERAQAGRVRILVIGEAKRGKSTLVNALFERDLLPTGALPLTSVASVVIVADRLAAEVRYSDGRVEPIRLDEVAGLVSQRGNPDNVKRVDRVRVTAPSPHLPAGTEVVDTPGTGSVYEANTVESARARSTVDVAVLVVAADPPVSAAELALVTDVMTTAAAAAVVVNKTDLVAADDVADIVAFTRTAVGAALGGEVPIFPMSLRGGTEDVAGLVCWLTDRLSGHGSADVVASTARALRRDATAVLDRLRVEAELLRRTGRENSAVATALRDILDHAAASASTTVDHVRGQARRARELLDAQHDRQVVDAVRAAHAALGPALPGRDTPELAATALRGRIADLVVSRCRAWFDRVTPELDATLRAAAEQALSELGERLAAARASAEDVLELRLAEVEPPAASRPPATPELRFSEEADWRELVSSAVARHLPTEVRRRRLHKQVRDWADRTVPRPFGRARASLQAWLEETTRTVERDLDATWQDHLAALRQGLEAAERHRDRTDAELSGPLDTITGRIDVARGVVRDLDALLATTRVTNPTTARRSPAP